MATYYFAVAFQTSDLVSDDGTHYDAQYGFGADTGSGPVALGSSGPGAVTFESVQIPASTNNQQNQFVAAIFSDLIGIDQSRSFVRVSFRPAHDTAPATNLALSPFNQADANNLLTGFFLSASNVTSMEEVNNGTKFGLPKDSYATQWLLPAASFVSGQRPGSSLHFEVTMEVSIVMTNGSTWTCYKIDPEMQIDF